MIFRTLLSSALVASLNLSLCSGGVLSAFALLGSQSTPITQDDSPKESIPMTFALLRYMSCVSSEKQTGVTSAPQASGCKDKQACLSQTHQELSDRTLFALSG